MYFFYYYPIGVDVPRPRVPWLTLGMMILFTAVFVLSVPLAWTNEVAWGRYVYRPALLDPLTPLTAVALHGGWLHLVGNLIYLWVFGPPIERALGKSGLLVVFAGTGYLGNLAHGAIVAQTDPDAMIAGVVGASGAISGLLGMFLVRYPSARIRIAWWAFLPLQAVNRAGVVELPSIVGMFLWFALQIVMALVEGPAAGTAYGAHLGGLGTGLVLALALGMPWRAKSEGLLLRAQRHLRRGNPHAAVGLLQRYLERVPWDLEGHTQLARAHRLAGDLALASRVYREVVVRLLTDDRNVDACEIHVEARRGDHAFHLGANDQRRIAFYLEKQGRWQEAVDAHIDFVRFHAGHPEAIVSQTRAATLLVTRLARRSDGLREIEDALRRFPEHPLREVLQQEHRRLARAAV